MKPQTPPAPSWDATWCPICLGGHCLPLPLLVNSSHLVGHSLHNFSLPSSGSVSHSVSPCSHGNSCPLLGLHFLFHTLWACVTFYLSQPMNSRSQIKTDFTLLFLWNSSWYVVVLLQSVIMRNISTSIHTLLGQREAFHCHCALLSAQGAINPLFVHAESPCIL